MSGPARTFTGHGWAHHLSTRKGPALHVGKVPGRKLIALYEANGSIAVLAWFTSEENARRALELIDWLTEARDAAPAGPTPVKVVADGKP